MTTQATDVSIRKAGPDDGAVVAATVAAGFWDDPVVRWLLPDEERRRQVIEAMFRLHGDAYIGHGETYMTGDGAAVSLWLPPGEHLLTAEQEEAFGSAAVEMFGDDVGRVAQIEELFAEHHPKDDLWYLNFLATVPASQGKGLGSALLRQQLGRADREGVPAYLEATTERNRALYARHGFVDRDQFTLPDDGPTLYPMWRDPR